MKSLQTEIEVKHEIFISDDIKSEQVSLSDDSQDVNIKDELNDDISLKNEDITHGYDTEDEFLSVIKKIKYEYVEMKTNENGM